MIHLSNGHSFEYMVASGALAYDGRGWPWEWPLRWLKLIRPELFTIVTKTLTAKPRKGNLRWSHPWSCVSLLKDGVANAIGLTNPGIDHWIQTVAPHIQKRGYDLVVSITDDDPKILATMVQKLNMIPIKAIELNASCPNTDQEMHRNVDRVLELVQVMKNESRHPLFLKLSPQQDYIELAKHSSSYVEAFSINSVPWKMIFPHQKSPLLRFGGGGVSGKVAQKITWKMLADLSQATTTPLIGPSVWSYEDLEKIRSRGASAISFGSIFLKHPLRPLKIVRRDQMS